MEEIPTRKGELEHAKGMHIIFKFLYSSVEIVVGKNDDVIESALLK